jgi:hypothetical protein
MVVMESGRPAVGPSGTNAVGSLFADAGCTTPAEAYADAAGVQGALLPLDDEGGRRVVLNGFGEQPDYWGPADGTSVLWIRVNGVVSRVNADYDPRISDLNARKVDAGDARLTAAGLLVSQQAGASDKARLQAAVNNAAPFGATVIIDGALSVSGSVTVPSGARIDGSRGSVTQTADLSATFFVNNASDVVIRNVRAVGKATDYVASSSVLAAAAVYIAGTSSNVLIDGCDLRGHAGVGVFIGAGVKDVRVANCRLQGPGPDEITPLANNYGMGVVGGDGSSDWSVTNCDISLYAQGINSGDVSNVRIIGNTIHDMTGQHGIYLDAVNNLVVANNQIRDTGLQGIKVQIANSTVGQDIDDVAITGNVLTNIGSHGILLTKAVTGSRQTRRASVVGNTVTTSGAGGDGINLIGVHGAVISANVVHNARHGLIASSCVGLTVGLNRFHSCQQNGVLLLDTTDVDLVYNRVLNPSSENNPSAEFGIQMSGVTADCRIVGNVVSDAAGNMRYGLYLNTSQQATITVRNNDLTGATDHGARMDSTQGIKEWSGNVLAGGLGATTGFPSTFVRGAPGQATGTAAPTTGTWARGEVLWNRTPTPGGVLGWVCTTAGTPGSWSAFGRSLSSSWTGPTANALLGGTFDPIQANASMPAMTAGVLYVARVDLPVGGSVAAVELLLGGAGAGLTAGQNLVGVYEAAAGGALLAQSGDQSAAWAGTGQKSATLTAPTAAQDAGGAVYVALLWNGTTSPVLRGLAVTASFVNVKTTLPRYATAGSALTALPATLPALTAAVATPWVGLS